ncbi:hypothetical protein BDV95DRAFT_596058 [Massariosphaeria phaeospora]|uniref:DNA-directed DNA polymerase n=1 Tax=Massariosphaeria phaeospora TaxID=100035 RepID=A0A7C8I395_9PLEO|nr:hypothetical protein BDV95DRAFT_596058 [Massariosphaeria phaeospora]
MDKESSFKDQELLDISDDETNFPDSGYLKAQRALMPPPRKPSGFLGKTPKEKQAEFEAHTARQRAKRRPDVLKLIRSTTAPDPEITKSFPIMKSRQEIPVGATAKLKRVSSLPEMAKQDQISFYRQMGVIPRELKNGKKVKPADKIKLDPEHKQLLRHKIVYFVPNDDISMARRQRIHKVIELGAAWVTSWRDDITHIMVDDGNYTYSQLLKHLNKPGLPRKVVLVQFDPYVPESIQFGRLWDPTLKRFRVKNAPGPPLTTSVSEPVSIPFIQTPLQIRPSGGEKTAQAFQKTDSRVAEEESPSIQGPHSPSDERVNDSFVEPATSPSKESTTIQDNYNDALSEAIQQTKALSHLPLDEEDEDTDSRPGGSGDQDSDSGTDIESPKAESKRIPRSKFTATTAPSSNRTSTFNQSAFSCMNPNSTNTPPENPNARTIQVLDNLCKYYDQMQDQWRTLAYRKGITTLRKQPIKITTAKQAAALPFIGARLAAKIEEIVLTDRLRKLDCTRTNPTDQVLRLFLGVYGAGLAQANKWVQAGHRTLADLVASAKLTESQEIGIEHYDDFATRIPRAEVEQHGAIVRNALRKIDPAFQATIMGSYRRGALNSGDIDLIITAPNTPLSALRSTIFHTLVPALFASNFLCATLASSWSKSDTDTGTKWHGASRLPNSHVWRRLDLLLVPESEMGAALIYFTGNDIFNRSMRLLASKKGMRLNQRGLYRDVIRGRNRERINEGVLVEGRDEKKIFEVLGVPWREPEERIC